MNIQELIERRQRLVQELREIDDYLGREVLEMPSEMLSAYRAGIIKFNFPVPVWVKNTIFEKY